MNYYEHHIGDYAEATAHLSFIEDAAYIRMIRKYYAIEKPLPTDIKAVQRLVGARAKEEREAVETVLNEFFNLQLDGWHNPRCDEDIAKYQSKKPGVEAKKENDRDRQRRARERRKVLFEELRSHGVVAPWDATNEQLQDALSRVTTTSSHPPVTQPVTRDNTAIQSPVPSPQSPDINTNTNTSSPISTPALTRSDDEKPNSPAEWIEVFAEQHGVDVDHRNFHDRKKFWPLAAAWTNSGVTVGQMRAACAKAHDEAKESIAWLPAYVDRVLSTMQSQKQAPKSTEPTWRKEQRERTMKAVPSIAEKQVFDDQIFDVEARNVTAIALG